METTITFADQLKEMTISEIASVIRTNWKNVYFGAVPYLEAMETLNSINDNYYADSGRTIVMYFLSNATTWKALKGDQTPKLVKAELNRRLKG